MTRRRIILLALCVALAAGIAYERGVAEELDSDCGSLCKLGCAGEGGCLAYRQVGCACQFVCKSGAKGGTVCGGEGDGGR